MSTNLGKVVGPEVVIVVEFFVTDLVIFVFLATISFYTVFISACCLEKTLIGL